MAVPQTIRTATLGKSWVAARPEGRGSARTVSVYLPMLPRWVTVNPSGDLSP
jgi:hypothetical protein